MSENRRRATISGRSDVRPGSGGDRASQANLEALEARLADLDKRLTALERLAVGLHERWEARFPSPRNSCPKCGRMSGNVERCSWCGAKL